MPTPRFASIQTRTIKWLYILALSLVAILTMSGQVLVQWSLSALQGDATTVNIAGRQRMFSQRIPRIILALDASRRSSMSDPSDVLQTLQTVEELRDSLEVWRANHLGLANASSAVGLSRAKKLSEKGSDPLEALAGEGQTPFRTVSNSQPINELFAKIEPDFRRVEDIATSVMQRMADANREVILSDDRIALLKHSDAFLASMDAIVAQYEFEAKQRVGRLQRIERGLLIATLLVLACEGFFIFSPAIASLDRAFQRLKTVTDQLESAKKSAEQANLAKTQFLARVSHELRTPLHAILGMLGLIRQGRLTRGQKQRADLAYKASRTLRHLVDDLLDISSVGGGSASTLHLDKTNVAQVTSDCVSLMSQHARRKRLKLTAISELPSGAGCLLDEYRLRQILINLIQNAIRYTSTGEIECRTWLEKNFPPTVTSDQVWLNISVRDTGCGIAPENLDRIFENFVRINPQDESRLIGPRLGLGLPITASLVAMMQGTITVESKLGAGSTFSIRLPTVFTQSDDLCKQPKRNPRISSKEASQHDASHSLVTALVVDDSKVNRLLLRDYLKRFGIRALTTNSLTRALRLYEERIPELVLLDLHVGQQQSLGLASSIRALPSGSQALIYIITADSHFTMQSCPVEIDVAGIFNKPIEFEELSAELKPVLQSLDQLRSNAPNSPNQFDDLRAKLRWMLSQQLPSEISRLQEAFTRQDYKSIQLIAHRLRGSASNAGWKELAATAAKLEADPTTFPSIGLDPLPASRKP